MSKLKQLNDRVISRLNTNLNGLSFDSNAFVSAAIDDEKMMRFYAFYGITAHHPISFDFKHSNIAGSYFLGKCHVSRSTIYKSDIRGDELKKKGDPIDCVKNIPLLDDEMITIRDSLLYKTLVHSHSHNPESPEEFSIRNTIAAHYSNIHGSTLVGCFLYPFATVDLMNLHASIIGPFSYVQAGELFHRKIGAGTVWVKHPEFEFKYRFAKEILSRYVQVDAEYQPCGIIFDFVKQREKEYERLFDVVSLKPLDFPESSAVNRYAVIKGKTIIGENVLVAQRAFLDNARLGCGSNVQENAYVVDAHLEGMNVTAHGAKIVHAQVGFKTFVGFNAFVHGKKTARVQIGKGCIIMPHTIIAPKVFLDIPDDHLVWGYIRSFRDLDAHTISLSEFETVKEEMILGKLSFSGNGHAFIKANKDRINQILKANGAFFQNGKNRGHAQDGQNISFNTLQPYATGENRGIFPSVCIDP
ncbi:MAG: transferase [Desulfobacter sp.]|nr:transferase [Desulfobacter sp.]WDP86753.1 MAG: transferase [Desulfobacter sp.]